LNVPKLEQFTLIFKTCQGFQGKVSSRRFILMVRATRHTPKRLGEKLALIRKSLQIETVEEMVTKLDVKEINLYHSTVHEYERGKRAAVNRPSEVF